MDTTSFLSLSILIFSPLVASLLIASPIFGNNHIYIRRFAKTFMVLHFIYALLFIVFANTSISNFYTELTINGKNWIEPLGITASFKLDGLSQMFVLLTSFIFLLVTIISKTMIRTKQKLYYTLILILLSAILGIFTANDIFLFFVFWEFELIPAFILIYVWGDSPKSALKFLLYTFGGSLFILGAMIALYNSGYSANGELSGSMDFLRIVLNSDETPSVLQSLIFFGFLIGFGVKTPLIPLHSWLPDAHTDAATPVSIILSAILLKTGAYGIIKFNMEILPSMFEYYAPYIAIIAVITTISSSLAAYKQEDIKRIIAYSSISTMGLVVLGLSAYNSTGFNGAIFLMFAHALVTAGLFTTAGIIHQTYKTREIKRLGGIGKQMPFLMIFTYILCFAGMGIPFTAGFPGEFMIFLGSFCSENSEILQKIMTAIALFAIIFTASYQLRFFHSAFCYQRITDNDNNPKTSVIDITGHKFVVLAIICLVIVIFGLFPNSLTNIYNSFTEYLLELGRV